MIVFADGFCPQPGITAINKFLAAKITKDFLFQGFQRSLLICISWKKRKGKEGWDVIKPQLEKAKSGETVTVVMNGTSVVPKTVIDSIKGKDITFLGKSMERTSRMQQEILISV